MTKSHILAAIACMIGATTFAASAEARVNARQHHQHHRIAQGVQSGQLTRGEARHLRHQQARIARYEAKSRADGPGLTPRERANLAAMQNHASRSIYRQKHDAQRRP